METFLLNVELVHHLIRISPVQSKKALKGITRPAECGEQDERRGCVSYPDGHDQPKNGRMDELLLAEIL